jgi:hypothetical protein
MTLEELDKALNYPTIKVESLDKGNEFIERWRKLTIDNEEYEIEWYCNVCYLHHGALKILFNTVILSNTWPHRSKMNLQFYDSNEEICCILLIDKWEEEP